MCDLQKRLSCLAFPIGLSCLCHLIGSEGIPPLLVALNKYMLDDVGYQITAAGEVAQAFYFNNWQF